MFALTNLPETVKGALFARYSRSAKSLRRLFLDEFADKVGDRGRRGWAGRTRRSASARAEKLFDKVFNEYGDDSVAQLGGAHIACEYVSNVLTKLLEWGRLMAYLEQSTRYVPYTDRLHGRWRYHVPAEIAGGALRDRYTRTMDAAFECYAKWIGPMQEHFAARYPKSAVRLRRRPPVRDSRQGARHAARPAARRHAIQPRHLRHRPGVRSAAAPPARESAGRGPRLRRPDADRTAQGHPGVSRAGRPAGPRRASGASTSPTTRRETAALAAALLDDSAPEPRPEVTLTDFDADGEVRIVAAALYAVSDLPDDQLMHDARGA